jgi:hypothetical protein
MFDLTFLLDFRLAHKTLRQIAPIFMQAAYADSTLWPKQGGISGVSLQGALELPRVELAKFAVVDVIMSMLFGFTHLIPWNTVLLTDMPQARFTEWVPGCPPEFIIAFAKVNIWRTQNTYPCNMDQWRQIEADINAWRPCYAMDYPSESLKVVTRLAVQEAFRHAALIYLYMVRDSSCFRASDLLEKKFQGMCNLASGDSRIQDSCEQIVNLSSAVGANCNPGKAIHFLHSIIIVSSFLESA